MMQTASLQVTPAFGNGHTKKVEGGVQDIKEGAGQVIEGTGDVFAGAAGKARREAGNVVHTIERRSESLWTRFDRWVNDADSTSWLARLAAAASIFYVGSQFGKDN